MTKTIKGKRDRKPVLVAALSLLGASLGIAAPAAAASDTTGIWVKDQATSKQIKGEAPESTQIKGETTSNQYKEHPKSQQLKFWAPPSTQIKGETTSTQHKGNAPSAQFLKLDATKSNQLKLDTTSSQHKGTVQSNQLKLNTPGGSQTQ